MVLVSTIKSINERTLKYVWVVGLFSFGEKKKLHFYKDGDFQF